jgi:glucuronate isomerase
VGAIFTAGDHIHHFARKAKGLRVEVNRIMGRRKTGKKLEAVRVREFKSEVFERLAGRSYLDSTGYPRSPCGSSFDQ